MRVIVHDAVKSANAPKPFVLLWESIRSAIWILLAAVLVMTGESAMARGSVTTVLDDFSPLRAWSTMRDDARMKVEYASWQKVVDRDGRSGPCLRLSFSPRTNSADIWGAFNIEEPIDGIGL